MSRIEWGTGGQHCIMALGWKRFRESLPPPQAQALVAVAVPGNHLASRPRRPPSNRARWLLSSRSCFHGSGFSSFQYIQRPGWGWGWGTERALVVGRGGQSAIWEKDILGPPLLNASGFKGRPWDPDRALPRTRSHRPAGSPGATPLGAGHRPSQGPPWA